MSTLPVSSVTTLTPAPELHDGIRPLKKGNEPLPVDKVVLTDGKISQFVDQRTEVGSPDPLTHNRRLQQQPV